ncbi:ACT domain-containing protein [Streptomyces sp. NPDC047014]|uniref:ACT domain-containing protein n=1 Tax=Streptomyces sp. NPDC047014 TaxID=3155736 RepID=UPI0033EE501A
MEHPLFYGVCHDTGVARVTVAGVPARPGVAAAVFRCLAVAGVPSDMAQNTSTPGGRDDLLLVVPEGAVAHATAALDRERAAIGFATLLVDAGIATVAVVGAGLRSDPHVLARYFETLRDGGVTVEAVSLTESRIAVVTRERDAERAARHLRSAFLPGDPDLLLHQAPVKSVMLINSGKRAAS